MAVRATCEVPWGEPFEGAHDRAVAALFSAGAMLQRAHRSWDFRLHGCWEHDRYLAIRVSAYPPGMLTVTLSLRVAGEMIEDHGVDHHLVLHRLLLDQLEVLLSAPAETT